MSSTAPDGNGERDPPTLARGSDRRSTSGRSPLSKCTRVVGRGGGRHRVSLGLHMKSPASPLRVFYRAWGSKTSDVLRRGFLRTET